MSDSFIDDYVKPRVEKEVARKEVLILAAANRKIAKAAAERERHLRAALQQEYQRLKSQLDAEFEQRVEEEVQRRLEPFREQWETGVADKIAALVGQALARLEVSLEALELTVPPPDDGQSRSELTSAGAEGTR